MTWDASGRLSWTEWQVLTDIVGAADRAGRRQRMEAGDG